MEPKKIIMTNPNSDLMKSMVQLKHRVNSEAGAPAQSDSEITREVFASVAKINAENGFTAEETAENPKSLAVEFVSVWEEGEVVTNAVLDLETGEVTDIETSDEGAEYKQLLFEEIRCLSRGVSAIVEAKNDNRYFLFDPEMLPQFGGTVRSKTLSSTEYASQGGAACPVCHSRNISAGECTFEKGTAYAHVRCNSCPAEWTETYRLTGYSDLETD